MSGDMTETMAERRVRERRERIAAARQRLAQAYADNPDAVDRYNARRARLDAADKRERERFEHLVLGHPRPTVTKMIGKKAGRRRPKRIEVPAALSPGIEEAVRLREAWSQKQNGTPETWERATNTHAGALAQLHANGTITADQLEWAAEIANVHRSIEADVAIKTASLETRVDQSVRGASVAEGVYRVRMHLAYTYWRALLPIPRQMMLDMIVGDAIGYTVAARRYRVHNRKAKRLLIEAIDRWPHCVRRAFLAVDADVVDRMNEALPTSGAQRWLERPRREEMDRHDREQTRATCDDVVATAAASALCPDMPPPELDPAFLDEFGRMKEWPEIAEIIRQRVFGAAHEEA